MIDNQACHNIAIPCESRSLQETTPPHKTYPEEFYSMDGIEKLEAIQPYKTEIKHNIILIGSEQDRKIMDGLREFLSRSYTVHKGLLDNEAILESEHCLCFLSENLMNDLESLRLAHFAILFHPMLTVFTNRKETTLPFAGLYTGVSKDRELSNLRNYLLDPTINVSSVFCGAAVGGSNERDTRLAHYAIEVGLRMRSSASLGGGLAVSVAMATLAKCTDKDMGSFVLWAESECSPQLFAFPDVLFDICHHLEKMSITTHTIGLSWSSVLMFLLHKIARSCKTVAHTPALHSCARCLINMLIERILQNSSFELNSDLRDCVQYLAHAISMSFRMGLHENAKAQCKRVLSIFDDAIELERKEVQRPPLLSSISSFFVSIITTGTEKPIAPAERYLRLVKKYFVHAVYKYSTFDLSHHHQLWCVDDELFHMSPSGEWSM